MHRGFICSWRKSFDSDVSKNVNVWYFWSWCLHRACYQEQKVIMNFQEIILQPGQLIFGRKKASEDMPLSEQEIRTCIRFLEKIGNLTIKSTNKFSIITIINWHIYQDKEQRINQHTNQQLTSKQPATNQQLTTYNKDKQLEQRKTIKEKTFSSELEKPSSPEAEPFVFHIPLSDKTQFGITQTDLDKWKDVFPAVDIIQELKRIALWCEDNPTKKKTRRGVGRFISSWLERKQNKGGNGTGPVKSKNNETIKQLMEQYDDQEKEIAGNAY